MGTFYIQGTIQTLLAECLSAVFCVSKKKRDMKGTKESVAASCYNEATATANTEQTVLLFALSVCDILQVDSPFRL